MDCERNYRSSWQAQELKARIRKVVTVVQWATLNLVWQGLTQEVIADRMGVARTTIAMRMREIRAIVAEMLRDEYNKQF